MRLAGEMSVGIRIVTDFGRSSVGGDFGGTGGGVSSTSGAAGDKCASMPLSSLGWLAFPSAVGATGAA